METSERLWTLDELTSAVSAALAEGYDGAASGRVRDVPDRRTIRYYTTLGLIDRAAAMRGRTALYGRKHLVQLVAIKKLQAAGKSLAEVQQALAGQTEAELSRIAELPLKSEARSRSSSTDFWRRTPAAHAATAERGAANPPADSPAPAPVDHRPMAGISLHPGVTLLMTPVRPLTADDIEVIRAAAAGLIRTLSRSHLIDVPEEGDHP